MTYLSQFPKAKLKPGAPLKPKLNPKKARAYGRGKDSVSLSCAEYLTLQKAGWGFLLMLNSRPTVTDFKVSLVYSWCGAQFQKYVDIVQKTLLVLTCEFPEHSEPVLQALGLAVHRWKKQHDMGAKTTLVGNLSELCCCWWSLDEQ